MEYVYLQGSEDVKRAAWQMSEAATEIKAAASWLTDTFQQHQRFLDDWLQRFEAVVKEVRV